MNTDVRHLQEQIKDARANNYPYFLTGSFRVVNGKYEIISRLYQTKNGTVASERIFRGDDFFSIIDSISLQTRVDLGISNDVIDSSPDLPFMEHSTSNLDAFRYYIRGFYIDSLSANLRKSIETDSTFAVALYYSASDNYNFQICHESALRDINQAIRHRKRLIETDDIWTRVLYYSILGEYDKAITLSEMQHELKPCNFLILKDLIFAYASNLMMDKYEKAARQLTEMVPNDPEYLIDLSYSYLHSGKLNQGLEVLEKLLESSSEDVDALLLAGEIYLHKNDMVNAERMFQKAILSQPENEKDWSKMYDYIDYSRNNPVNDEFLKSFTGSYRFDEGEMNVSFFIHNNHLTGKAKNQYPVFSYPVSDSKFISLNGTASFTFARNNQGEVIKTTLYQNDTYSVAWKEDSLITEALDLLNKGEKAEALSAFRKAYDRNPDHYYLADFIRHLEFIQSDRYEGIKPVLETCVGKYGDINVFKRNDLLYYEDKRGYFYKILPLSEDRFMIPSSYNRQIQIIEKNNSKEGLKFVNRDGNEKFFPRNN